MSDGDDGGWPALAVEGARHLDNVLWLFELEEEDYSVVDDALAYLARLRARVPSLALSARTVRQMRRRGLLGARGGNG